MAGRVVVGVDGSSSAQRALRWAADEAAYRDAELEAVLVWSYLQQPPTGDGPAEFRADFDEDAARAALAVIVDEALGDGAGRVRQTVVNDLPAKGLLEAAAGADLVVVGSRGRGGFRGLLLGSVSQQVVSHATAPVVIVRGEGDADQGPGSAPS